MKCSKFLMAVLALMFLLAFAISCDSNDANPENEGSKDISNTDGKYYVYGDNNVPDIDFTGEFFPGYENPPTATGEELGSGGYGNDGKYQRITGASSRDWAAGGWQLETGEVDLSGYAMLKFAVKSSTATSMKVKIEDSSKGGAAQEIPVDGITSEWAEKTINLDDFTAADKTKVKVVFAFVLAAVNDVIDIDEVRYEGERAPPVDTSYYLYGDDSVSKIDFTGQYTASLSGATDVTAEDADGGYKDSAKYKKITSSSSSTIIGGWHASMENPVDLSSYTMLKFAVKSPQATTLSVYLLDSTLLGGALAVLPISVSTSWEEKTIALDAFRSAHTNTLYFVFGYTISANTEIHIDEVRYEQGVVPEDAQTAPLEIPNTDKKYYILGDNLATAETEVDFNGKYYAGYDDTVSVEGKDEGGFENNGSYLSLTRTGNEWGAGGFQFDAEGVSVDLSSYNTLKFAVRSSTATSMKVKIEDSSKGGASQEILVDGITSDWAEKTINLDAFTAADKTKVKVLFAYVLNAVGDTVDIDEIRYEEEKAPPVDTSYYLYGDDSVSNIDFTGQYTASLPASTDVTAEDADGGYKDSAKYKKITSSASAAIMGGWHASMENPVDLSSYTMLKFAVKSPQATTLSVYLLDSTLLGGALAVLPISVSTSWEEKTIALDAFRSAHTNTLYFVFGYTISANTEIHIDEVRYEQGVVPEDAQTAPLEIPNTDNKYYIHGDNLATAETEVDFNGKYYAGYDDTVSVAGKVEGGFGNNGSYLSLTRTGDAWGAGGFQFDAEGVSVDLSSYNTLKFAVRSSKATSMKVKIEDSSKGGAAQEILVDGITSDWAEKTINLDAFTAAATANIRVLFAYVLNAVGDTVDIDEIRYEEEKAPPVDTSYYLYGDDSVSNIDFTGQYTASLPASTDVTAEDADGGYKNSAKYKKITSSASSAIMGGWHASMENPVDLSSYTMLKFAVKSPQATTLSVYLLDSTLLGGALAVLPISVSTSWEEKTIALDAFRSAHTNTLYFVFGYTISANTEIHIDEVRYEQGVVPEDAQTAPLEIPNTDKKYYIHGDNLATAETEVDFNGKYYAGYDDTVSVAGKDAGGFGNDGSYLSLTRTGNAWGAGGFQFDAEGVFVDLSSYDTLKFAVRSSKATSMKVKIEDSSKGGAAQEILVDGITSDWTEKTIKLDAFTAAATAKIRVLFAYVLNAVGDTVDIDEIRYEQAPLVGQ